MENSLRVTFALFAYNQERYVEQSVKAALEQTYPNIELILSDDCSTDKTFELMQSMVQEYDGPHTVILNRNPRNLGVGQHINKICKIASGDVIVIAAGDDISLPNRVACLAMVFGSNSDVYSVYSDGYLISDTGKMLTGTLRAGRSILPGTPNDVVFKNAHAYGCSHAWRRESQAFFGPLESEVVYEDRAISFRSSLLGKVEFVTQRLVKYRLHDNNICHGKLSLSESQLVTQLKRKIVETYQFILDLDRYLSSGVVSTASKAELGLLMRQLQMRHKILLECETSQIKTVKKIQLIFLILFQDRSVLKLVVQRLFPVIIKIRRWLGR